MSTTTPLYEIAQTSAPMVKLDITNNWTGRNELPFELVAERVLEIEAHDGDTVQKGPMTVRFGKPLLIEGQGWACVFILNAMGAGAYVTRARPGCCGRAAGGVWDGAQTVGRDEPHAPDYVWRW